MIGKTTKELRIKKGLSLTKLADLAGVEKSYLLSVENNNCLCPSIDFIEKIAPVLDVSTDTLISQCSQQTHDPIWNDTITEALQTGLTTEEYLAFLKFTKKQETNETSKLQSPISNLKTFIEKQQVQKRIG